MAAMESVASPNDNVRIGVFLQMTLKQKIVDEFKGEFGPDSLKAAKLTLSYVIEYFESARALPLR